MSIKKYFSAQSAFTNGVLLLGLQWAEWSQTAQNSIRIRLPLLHFYCIQIQIYFRSVFQDDHYSNYLSPLLHPEQKNLIKKDTFTIPTSVGLQCFEVFKAFESCYIQYLKLFKIQEGIAHCSWRAHSWMTWPSSWINKAYVQVSYKVSSIMLGTPPKGAFSMVTGWKKQFDRVG